MEYFWIIFIATSIIVAIYLVCLMTTSPSAVVENLRIQGSHDIRGDPVIPGRDEFCSGMGSLSPWNNGSNCPIFNRQMIME